MTHDVSHCVFLVHCVMQVAEMFKMDGSGKVTAVQVFYDLVC